MELQNLVVKWTYKKHKQFKIKFFFGLFPCIMNFLLFGSFIFNIAHTINLFWMCRNVESHLHGKAVIYLLFAQQEFLGNYVLIMKREFVYVQNYCVYRTIRWNRVMFFCVCVLYLSLSLGDLLSKILLYNYIGCWCFWLSKENSDSNLLCRTIIM